MKKLILLCLVLISCTVMGNVVKEYSLPTEVYFCPREDCTNIMINYFSNSNKINCAIYDLNIPEMIDVLKSRNARMVLDDGSDGDIEGIRDSKYSQMHNKFCILDDQMVITGSFNPTIRGSTDNNNNVVVFHSKNIASAYNDEFEELFSKTFSGGERTKNSIFYVNNDRIEVYFCPEDWCANKVLYTLDKAKQSIYFMTYSFTHDQIGDMIIKKKNQGLDIKGLMEKSQNSQYSEFKKLNESGIDVVWDKNKGLMHNKVFIIDSSIVITGSFNPTLNGDTSNDENLVIIYNQDVAKEYLEEFNLLRS